MVLKLYYDLMSQPSRALYIFLKSTKIDFVGCKVALRKGEHLSEEYAAQVNPFHRVPVIHHDDFKLPESVAIFRYLTAAFPDHVADHWYPKDLRKRARVDEFMEWQHLNVRIGGSMLFRKKFIEPIVLGVPFEESKAGLFVSILEDSLDGMENVFLKDGRQYLCGSEITLADLLGSCEVEQPLAIGFDVYGGRPKLRAWMTRVEERMKPFYAEAHGFVRMVPQKMPSPKL